MSEFPKELRFKLSDPLNQGDSEIQTYGCRHTNPDICGSCYVSNVCAFTSKDNICRKPSVKWKKNYLVLRGKSDEV